MKTRDFAVKLRENIGKVIKGKERETDLAAAALICGGHVLLEDVPGTGKTVFARAMAKSLDCDFRRIQFTPDLLPSDITGINFYNMKEQEFRFRKGPVFTNILLADEINRATPRTQSALLEVMEEGKATVDGVTRMLPNPFVVLATQNPFGSAGTQKLPESQLDRFMICTTIGYPSHSAAMEILSGSKAEVSEINPILSIEEFLSLQEDVKKVFVDRSINEFIISFIENTRKNPYISLGISPRGSIALLKMAKATALISERDYVVPDDVIYNIPAVCAHRIVLSPKAKAQKLTEFSVLKEVLNETPLPKM